MTCVMCSNCSIVSCRAFQVARSVTKAVAPESLREVEHLFGGEQDRGRHRNGATLHRTEEDDRVLEAIGETDEDAVARGDAEVAEQLRRSD